MPSNIVSGLTLDPDRSVGSGAYAGLPFSMYSTTLNHLVNFSRFKHIKHSPGHVMTVESGPDTSARKLGRLVHLLTFEPRALGRHFAVPEAMPRRTADQRIAADARDRDLEVSGITPVTQELWDRAHVLASNARNHPAVTAILSKSFTPELTLVWEDPCFPGGRLKARLDYYSESVGVVADLKTCGIGQARPDKFISIACGALSNYHWQAAWYMRGLKALGMPANSFVWIAVETDGPMCVSVINCNSEILEYANREIEQHLKSLSDYMTAGSLSFLSYGSKIITPETPAWVKEKSL